MPQGNPHDPLLLFAQMAAYPSFVPLHVPEILVPETPLISDPFIFAALLRVLPRTGRGIRPAVAKSLSVSAAKLSEQAQRLLISRKTTSAEVLWHYWLIVLARQRLKLGVTDLLLKALWQRAFSGQNQGRLHHAAGLDAPASALADLRALHAACNAIIFTQDFDLFPQVQQLADTLAAIAPDEFPAEPWALAAFASLDRSATVAPRQIQAMRAYASTAAPSPLALSLLADAVLAQEDIANV